MAPFQAIYRRDRKWEFEDSHHGRNMRPEEGSLVDNIRCLMGLVFGAGGAVRPSVLFGSMHADRRSARHGVIYRLGRDLLIRFL